MVNNETSPWDGIVSAPGQERTTKPRKTGHTMIIDKGLTLMETRELFQLCAPFLDFVKFGFGTSVLYRRDILHAKIQEARRHGIDVYPGGTLLELAVIQGRVDAFIERAGQLGFTAIEVSEGTIDLERALRRRLIQRARQQGLRVISEVGKKDRNALMDAGDVLRQVEEDLESGAELVIIEGRDSGKGVGVYDETGAPREALIDGILAGVSDSRTLMWEAPITSQQQYWLKRVGINVNLGNVQPHDLFTLETTRVGLRGDTLRDYVAQSSRKVE